MIGKDVLEAVVEDGSLIPTQRQFDGLFRTCDDEKEPVNRLLTSDRKDANRNVKQVGLGKELWKARFPCGEVQVLPSYYLPGTSDQKRRIRNQGGRDPRAVQMQLGEDVTHPPSGEQHLGQLQTQLRGLHPESRVRTYSVHRGRVHSTARQNERHVC